MRGYLSSVSSVILYAMGWQVVWVEIVTLSNEMLQGLNLVHGFEPPQRLNVQALARVGLGETMLSRGQSTLWRSIQAEKQGMLLADPKVNSPPGRHAAATGSGSLMGQKLECGAVTWLR
jgi:hypothetical protein